MSRIFSSHRLALLASVMACITSPVLAGDWRVTPSISLNETWTDNVALARDALKESDLVTDISPGLRIEGAGGRSKLSFDYQMHNLYYSKDSSRNQTQNYLNALGTLEAVDNWLFIEASGHISQQSISAFGSSSASTSVNVNDNRNTTETSTYRISPYVIGSFGSFADYQLRANMSTSSSDTQVSNDTYIKELVGSLKGVTRLNDLSWSMNANSQRVSYDRGRDSEGDRLQIVLTYRLDPQFNVLLIGGRESNNYLTPDTESNTTRGAGFEWAPTERTQIAVRREDRFFGDSNTYSISHRTARTAFKYTESEDATVQAEQYASAGIGTFGDLAMTICASILPPGSSASDLANCANGLLGGASPNTQVPGGFLSSGVTLEKRRDLSFALFGARNTVTFAAFDSDSSSLAQGTGTAVLVGTDFANFQRIKQRGGSVNWSHQLTALSSLVASYSRIDSEGTGTSDLKTDQTRWSLNFTTRLGPKTHAGIGARRVTQDGTSNYTENALTGVVSHRF